MLEFGFCGSWRGLWGGSGGGFGVRGLLLGLELWFYGLGVAEGCCGLDWFHGYGYKIISQGGKKEFYLKSSRVASRTGLIPETGETKGKLRGVIFLFRCLAFE